MSAGETLLQATTGSGKGFRQRTRFCFILTLNMTFICTDALYELLSQMVSEESGVVIVIQYHHSCPVLPVLSAQSCGWSGGHQQDVVSHFHDVD